MSLVVLPLGGWAATADPSNPEPGSPRTLQVGVGAELAPLAFVDPAGVLSGFTPEILHAVEQHSGLRFTMHRGGWYQQWPSFKEGRLDILTDTISLDSQRDQFSVSLPYFTSRYTSYTRRGQAQITTTAQLAGKKIAVVHGSTAHLFGMEKDAWDGTLQDYPTVESALQATASGASDVTIGWGTWLRTQDSELLAKLDHVFFKDLISEFRFALHKQDTVTMMQLNDALLSLHNDGTIDELYRKWLVPEIVEHKLRWAEIQMYVLPLILVTIIAILLAIRQWSQAMVNRDRIRIARDLHDDLGNRLSEMQLLAESVTLIPGRDATAMLTVIRGRLIEGAESLNQLIWALSPSQETWGYLGESIEKFTRRYLGVTQIRHTVTVEIGPDHQTALVPPHARHVLTMCIREMLRNAINHARSDDIRVVLSVGRSTVKLVVTDSGPGVDPEVAMQRGRGLFRMRQRLKEIKGEVSLSRGPAGFSVQIEFPSVS